MGCEADHSPPSSVEVKEWVELYLHSPTMSQWRGAQLKAQGQLYLYLYLLLYHLVNSFMTCLSIHHHTCYAVLIVWILLLVIF